MLPPELISLFVSDIQAILQMRGDSLDQQFLIGEIDSLGQMLAGERCEQLALAESDFFCWMLAR
jgi:hypothetical protein